MIPSGKIVRSAVHAIAMIVSSDALRGSRERLLAIDRLDRCKRAGDSRSRRLIEPVRTGAAHR
jgi:hypothetical protein